MSSPRVTFITGGTGLVGGEMIPRVLDNDEDGIARVLVRAEDDEAAARRLDETLRFYFAGTSLDRARDRVTAVRGDIAQDRLGLDTKQHEALAEQVTHIVHSAASVDWDLPYDTAHEINVEGARRMLDLARDATAHRLERFVHVSTSYVSGRRRGHITEDELDEGQSFLNTYEQTKFLAEKMVRERMGEAPCTVVRPCAVIGDSRTGRTRSFNVLYFPLKLLSHNLLHLLPGGKKQRVEVVPCDYVSAATNHVMLSRTAESKTFHLTAGAAANTAGHLTELSVALLNELKDYDEPLPTVRFLPRWIFRFIVRPYLLLTGGHEAREIQAMLDQYLSYLLLPKRFDTTNIDAALKGTGIAAPRLDDYFREIIQYCIDSNWGRREVAVAETA